MVTAERSSRRQCLSPRSHPGYRRSRPSGPPQPCEPQGVPHLEVLPDPERGRIRHGIPSTMPEGLYIRHPSAITKRTGSAATVSTEPAITTWPTGRRDTADRSRNLRQLHRNGSPSPRSTTANREHEPGYGTAEGHMGTRRSLDPSVMLYLWKHGDVKTVSDIVHKRQPSGHSVYQATSRCRGCRGRRTCQTRAKCHYHVKYIGSYAQRCRIDTGIHRRHRRERHPFREDVCRGWNSDQDRSRKEQGPQERGHLQHAGSRVRSVIRQTKRWSSEIPRNAEGR